MLHIPALITDLALILIVAGLTTLLFKKINQPMVLGYILAGILVSPLTGFFPSVADKSSITVWSDIGVIFLLFSIGLEFSIQKLLKMGGSSVITAATVITAMLGIGFGTGMLLGWEIMDCVFLGGMICMSSTTIIAKAYEDLKLQQKRFTQVVLGTLIIEDVAAIFLMVILSTISASRSVSGSDLAVKLIVMVIYLVVWLFLGIYIIPSFLKKTSRLMNDETMLIVSLGICFGMVWLANALGYSSALGAFLAGSILAGTVHAERIESLVKPCKDLFGAVFFVSVGLLVDPTLLLKYITPVIVITLVVIICQPLFSFFGLMFAGKDSETAVRGAFSFSQIGEFSLIIAGLGSSLKVTSEFLYPVIVAVSVITTFTTPFMIKVSEPVSKIAHSFFPEKWNEGRESSASEKSDWKMYIERYLVSLIVYGMLTLGIGLIVRSLLLPELIVIGLSESTAALVSIIIFALCIIPFFRPLIDSKNKYFTSLFITGAVNRFKLFALVVIRTAAAVSIVMISLYRIYALPNILLFVVTIVMTAYISRSDWIKGRYLRIEAAFMANFNERQLLRQKKDTEESEDQRIFIDKELYVGTFYCPEGSKAIGKTLINLAWGKRLNAQIIKILRGNEHIMIPVGTETLKEGDRIFVLSSPRELENFKIITEKEGLLVSSQDGFVTLRDYIFSQSTLKNKEQMLCYAVEINDKSASAGKSIKSSGIKRKWNCAVIGIEHRKLPIYNPDPNTVLSSGDVVWLIGPEEMGRIMLSARVVT